MPYINQLPLVSQVNPGDQFVVWTPNNGDSRRLPVSELLAYFQEHISPPETGTTLLAPLTGFTHAFPITVSQNQWLILAPGVTLATGTLVLPLNTNTSNGVEILVTTTQQITAFTITLNGASAIYGNGLTSLAAGDSFRIKFYQPTNSWYRIA